MQGREEHNAIARQAERVGEVSITTSEATTPIINKANFAGLSGVKVSGTTTSFEFYVANGDSDFYLLDDLIIGNEEAFIAPSSIWAFEKVKIVGDAAGVYEIRLVG